MKKTAYITRYGAYGDHLHCSYLPRALKERCGYEKVVFESNSKGLPIYANNPHIDELVHFEPYIRVSTKGACMQMPMETILKRWRIKAEQMDADHINLQFSIENGYIAMEDMAEYYLSSEWRREHYGKLNYYDQCAAYIGRPELKGYKADLFFTDDEIKQVEEPFQKLAGKYVLIANLSGTSKHKMLMNAEWLVKTFLEQHPDAVCITMGDRDCQKHLEFKGERIYNRAGLYTFRQSMLTTKYAHSIVGCESGLMVAATALGCKTVQLMTAASIKNHGGDFANDYSLQSPVSCAPCHKGPYDYIGCPTFDYLGLKYPVCIKFDKLQVLRRLNEAYNDYSRETKKASSAEVSSVR